MKHILFLMTLILLFGFNLQVAAENEVLLISDFESGENLWIGYDQAQTQRLPAGSTTPEGYINVGDFHWGHDGEFCKTTSGFIPDTQYTKQGKTSGKWENTIINNRIAAWKIPHDWSKYNYLSMWIYSETANKAGIEFVPYSEDPKTKDDDYYKKELIINWKGWKLVEFSFKDFAPNRSPVGWHKIDYLKIASSAWGHTPLPDTVLYFDRMQLSVESLLGETLNEIPVEFKVNERPGLLVNASELKEAKEKIGKYPWAQQAYEELKLDADRWMTREIKLPDTGGGYYHAGGEEYEITEQHYDLARASRTLALMYWLDGNEAYAKKSESIIRGYTQKYPTYELHDKDGNIGKKASAGGRVTPQGINEAQWVIPLAWAYDLLYQRFTLAERDEIENKIFRPVAELLLANNEGRHNHQAWYNSGIGVIGFLLKDPKYIRHALYKPDSGFLFQMEQSITPDGFWYESTGHYHYYAMRCLKDLAEAAVHSGFNLYENAAYRSIYTFPIIYSDPSGNLPTINDGRVVTLTEDDRAVLFESAYRHSRDPYIVPILKGSSRNSIDALLYGVPELPDVKLPPLKSQYLASGQAILRSGQNGKVDNYLVLNGMPYAGGHSHYDKLSLLYYANGRVLAPDPGSVKYLDPLHTGWFKVTLAHNTVVLNEKTQQYSVQARLAAFADGPVVQMARMQDSRSYPGSMLDRMVLMTDWYLFDLFQIHSDTSHTADWVWHNIGKFQSDFSWSPVTLKQGDGYQYLKEPKTVQTKGSFTVSWEANSGRLDLHHLSEDESQIITGTGKVAAPVGDVPSAEEVPALIIRKPGQDISFDSILVPAAGDFKYQIAPEAVKVLVKEPLTSSKIAAYRLTSRHSDDLLYYGLAKTVSGGKPVSVKVGPIETNAGIAWARKTNGVATEFFMAHGSFLKAQGWRFEIEDLTAGPTNDLGIIHVSPRPDSIEVKNDSGNTVLLHFTGKKVKSLQFFENGHWITTEPSEVANGRFSFLADRGLYRLNF